MLFRSVTSYNTIAFNNAIKPGSIFSTKFQTPGGRTCVYTDVNPNNNTFTIVQNTINGEVQVNNTTNVVYLADITNPQTPVYTVGGTVNYTAGLIVFSQINIINTASNPGITVLANPVNQNVVSINNNVLEFDFSNISISALPRT